MKKKIIIIIVVVALLVSSFTPIMVFFVNLLKKSDEVKDIKSITINLEVSLDGTTDKKQYKTDKNNIYEFLVQTKLCTFYKDEKNINRIKEINGKDVESTIDKKYYIYKNDIEVKDDIASIPIYENDTVSVFDKLKE